MKSFFLHRKKIGMGYIRELPNSIDKSWVDGITNSSEETILYITIAGQWHTELLECLDCIYLDNKRSFEMIQLKKQPKFVGACIAMKRKNVDSIQENAQEDTPNKDTVATTRQQDDDGKQGQVFW